MGQEGGQKKGKIWDQVNQAWYTWCLNPNFSFISFVIPHFPSFLLYIKPILPGIVPIGTHKKHLVSDWSMEDLEVSD